MTRKIILITILVIASVLRLWRLADYPSGFNADEAALGYNAYSLLTTGRDEHGHVWPVNLESFGDFKPAGYAYLLLPFVKLFGLNEFAVRLPSAIMGILAIYFIYLLVNETFSHKLGLISALMLAISPWHLHFSRGGWEVNVSTTLIIIGTWLFIKWTKKPQTRFLLTSVTFFVLSMYFYQSARITAPLLGLGLATLFARRFITNAKQTLVSGIVLVVLLFPLLISIMTSDASSRLSGVGLLADIGPTRRVEQLRGQHAQWGSILSRVLHNRPVIYSLQFLSNYFDHFDGDFLFVNGDEIQRNKVPETGLFYLTDFIFLALGIIFLVRNSNKLKTNSYRLIWLWILVAPLASSLTFQTPHALRAHSLVIPLTILTSLGIYSVINSPARWPKGLLAGGLGVIVIAYTWQATRYFHQYFVHYPQTYPAAWEYGFKELVAYTERVKDKYQSVLVTDKYDQPYILFLFYSKYSPASFQTAHKLTFRDRFNFSTVRDYDKYHFESTPWEKVRDIHSTLIVAAPQDIPDVGVNVVKTIYFPGGTPAFKIVSN